MNEPSISTSRRADMAAIAFVIGFPSLLTWVYFVLLPDHGSLLQRSVFGVGKVVQFGFPIAWFLAVQRQRLRLGKPSGRGVLEGLGIGLAILVTMLVLYFAFLKPAGHFAVAEPAIRDKMAEFKLNALWKYAVFGGFYALCHSFLEEYYWRWFVFGQLRRFVPPWAAVVVSAVGFMAHHIILLGVYFGPWSFATAFFSFAVCVGGVIWAWLYYHGKSLYGPWLSHLLVDAGIFYIGYDVMKDVLAH